jgi:hypothetical protein
MSSVGLEGSWAVGSEGAAYEGRERSSPIIVTYYSLKELVMAAPCASGNTLQSCTLSQSDIVGGIIVAPSNGSLRV